jgi:hypothetical protein
VRTPIAFLALLALGLFVCLREAKNCGLTGYFEESRKMQLRETDSSLSRLIPDELASQ